MKFEKWQALGNDYIILEAENLPWTLSPERIVRICDPHFGIGSDGILLISKTDDERYVAELRILTPTAPRRNYPAPEAILYLSVTADR
jgi:diaminopimelate epimerase